MRSIDELIETDKKELATVREECKKLVLNRDENSSWFMAFDIGLSRAWRIQQRLFFLENLKKEL